MTYCLSLENTAHIIKMGCTKNVLNENMQCMNQNPQLASTVVICSQSDLWPPKILLIKRSNKAIFLPNAHVFPGGRVEETDAHFGATLACDSVNFQRIAGFIPKHKHHIEMHIAAAIRETLEETGIILAAEAERAPLQQIWPISWWITPHGESRRYDTLFFLSMISEIQARAASIVDTESSSLLWLTPADALAQYETRDIFMPPPTRSILERIHATKSPEEFLSFVDNPLIAVEPFFTTINEDKTLILPGDSLHPQHHKPAMLMHTRYRFP